MLLFLFNGAEGSISYIFIIICVQILKLVFEMSEVKKHLPYHSNINLNVRFRLDKCAVFWGIKKNPTCIM